MYIALIGALIQPTNQLSVGEFDQLLVNELTKINETYGDSFALKLEVIENQEFHGLFKEPECLFEVIDKIKFAIHPCELQFGVGLGTIEEESSGANTYNGPAFWHARKALTQVREENASQLSRILLSAGGDGSEFQLLNDSLKLCDFVESRWRDSQRELVKISILASGHSDRVLQSKLAKELGISRQAANQRVQSSGFYQFIRMKKSVSETFSGVFCSLQ